MSSSATRRERAAKEKTERRLSREAIVLAFTYAPNALTYLGPVIITDLGVSGAHRDALVQAGQPVPPNVRCRFLIDTGAQSTVVKHDFAERAGLKLINDNVPLRGVGVDTTGRVYIGRITFACDSNVVPGARHFCTVDTQISAGNLETDLIDGLIGRDVLQHFALSYDGKSGEVKMRWHRPETTTR